jgi:hypothetical protein
VKHTHKGWRKPSDKIPQTSEYWSDVQEAIAQLDAAAELSRRPTGRRMSDEELLRLFQAARPPAILVDKDFQHPNSEDEPDDK